MLTLLGHTADGVDGRVLTEAFDTGPDPDGIEVEYCRVVTSGGGVARYLEFADVAGYRYLMEGGIQST